MSQLTFSFIAKNTCPEHPTAGVFITAGLPPHLARLDCGECGRYLKWLPKIDLRGENRAIVSNFGGC